MFWKILFFIYIAFILSISITGVSNTPEIVSKSFFDEIMVLLVVIFWFLAMIYTYALGWKKQLVKKVYNKYILIGGILATVLTGVYAFMLIYPPAYDEMLMYGMQQGMVPRNMDFQLMLLITRTTITIITLVYLFLLYAPFFVSYYFYGKHMKEFDSVKFAGRKIFTCFMFADIFPVIFLFLLGISGNILRYNIYDYISVLQMSIMLTGLFGYAFNKQIWSQKVWQILLPIIAGITLLPKSLLSHDFLVIIGGENTFQTSPLITISSWAITLGALYLLYKYAYTEEVFKRTEQILSQENTAETDSDSVNNNEDK